MKFLSFEDYSSSWGSKTAFWPLWKAYTDKHKLDCWESIGNIFLVSPGHDRLNIGGIYNDD